MAKFSKTVAELQSLQRERSIVLKSRNMMANRIQAIVAGTLGYCSGMQEKDRQKKFGEASRLIKDIAGGKETHPLQKVILTHLAGIDEFNKLKGGLEREMLRWAKLLPVAAWVNRKEQRGFGLLFLAIVVGETGDLSNYPNPGKVWRRLGCAPWAFDGKNLMGATWRGGKEGKLPASEWESYGYSPRRRSIAYLIGEGIVKQNFLTGQGNGEVVHETDVGVAAQTRSGTKNGGTGAGEHSSGTESGVAGPYRRRYDQAKAKAHASHPDWSDLRCHRHGMLLATKMLLRDLWVQWNKG